VNEPFTAPEVKKRIREILSNGILVVWGHARKEMVKDGLAMPDVENVLWAGRIQEPAEHEKGEWRYRFYTQKIAVIVGFDSENEAHVVTAWRYKR
jgi:hypothetical protein